MRCINYLPYYVLKSVNILMAYFHEPQRGDNAPIEIYAPIKNFTSVQSESAVSTLCKVHYLTLQFIKSTYFTCISEDTVINSSVFS